MEFKKNLAPFREFIKKNHKNALIYSNNISKFAEKSFRGEAFKIKSDLAHNVNQDEYLYIPVNLCRFLKGRNKPKICRNKRQNPATN